MTSWCGTIILVQARFQRTTTHGMVCVTPTALGRLHMRTIVWVKRRTRALARAVLDPIDARVRRSVTRRLADAGQRLGDIKPVGLSQLDGWTSHFESTARRNT